MILVPKKQNAILNQSEKVLFDMREREKKKINLKDQILKFHLYKYKPRRIFFFFSRFKKKNPNQT